MQYINNKLLADDFARNGIAFVFLTVHSNSNRWISPSSTYIPDYFNGDPITEEQLKSGTFNREEWGKRHGHNDTKPPLDAAIKGLQERGITTFGATSYCEYDRKAEKKLPKLNFIDQVLEASLGTLSISWLDRVTFSSVYVRTGYWWYSQSICDGASISIAGPTWFGSKLALFLATIAWCCQFRITLRNRVHRCWSMVAKLTECSLSNPKRLPTRFLEMGSSDQAISASKYLIIWTKGQSWSLVSKSYYHGCEHGFAVRGDMVRIPSSLSNLD